MKNYRKTTYFGMALSTLLLSQTALAQHINAYENDFDGNENFAAGVTGGISGSGQAVDCQGYAGLGHEPNVFAGNIWYNDSSGNPAASTVITLNNLPEHTSIDINFLLAIIGSWDGSSDVFCPDYLNIILDGQSIFKETFDYNIYEDQSYIPPDDVLLAWAENLGFPYEVDSAYDMGLDPQFDGIPHSANSLTLEIYADGVGWQGGDDEAWGYDNVSIILNSPCELTLDDFALPGIAGGPNTLHIADCTFGEVVTLKYSLSLGSTKLENCPGVSLDLQSPKLVGTAVVNYYNDAWITVWVPNVARGKKVYMQGYESATCKISCMKPITFQ